MIYKYRIFVVDGDICKVGVRSRGMQRLSARF